MTQYRRIATLQQADDFQSYCTSLGINIPFDNKVDVGPETPWAQPYKFGKITIGNRFAILPMEGWDGTTDGKPSELTYRRWRRFGSSGAKLIWGGEAVAVRHDGRANPNQLMISTETIGNLAKLREALVSEHEKTFGRTDDLFIGLQLTHSGRFSCPNDKNQREPLVLYDHPVLDEKFTGSNHLLVDDEIDSLIEDFIQAARLAQQAGFAFVDIKHCHGYLGHEFLSAVDRRGRYGGSFENRTLFLTKIIDGIRKSAPRLEIGVRLGAFDFVPFKNGSDGVGVPCTAGNYRFAFGSDGNNINLAETHVLLDLLESLKVYLVCISAGSPYYTPHIQRPALFPPSDGYFPPEDPLVGVARLINTTAELKKQHPNLIIVGSGYSYLQEWFPNVAQYVIRRGMADFIGVGRLALTYPDIIADVLSGQPPERQRLCRTFSDCTTAPRNGLVSGCYPLDEFYKNTPEAKKLSEIKKL